MLLVVLTWLTWQRQIVWPQGCLVFKVSGSLLLLWSIVFLLSIKFCYDWFKPFKPNFIINNRWISFSGILMLHCCGTRFDKPRVILLILLCVALGGTYIVEQPGSSVLRYYDRFEWLVENQTVSCLHFSIDPFVSTKCQYT